jgi:hypothetical protein
MQYVEAALVISGISRIVRHQPSLLCLQPSLLYCHHVRSNAIDTFHHLTYRNYCHSLRRTNK